MTTRKYKKNRSFRNSRSKKGGNKKEEEDCPICFEKINKEDNIPKLPCKHKFHKQCLEQVCRRRSNTDVPCPLCRGDISFACVSDITRDRPWKYSPHTNPTPYSQDQMIRMTMDERRQHDNEIQRHRRNYLSRRRRTIARETSTERTARERREQEFETQARQERDQLLTRAEEQTRRRQRLILSRGLPSPRSPDYTPPGYENNSPVYAPNSPDYPPPGYDNDSPMFVPQSPEGPPPLLTMEDLRTSPNSHSRTPPPLTMDDLIGGKRSIPRKYVPKRLSKKDKKKQLREIKKSRKAYKNRQYHTRKKVKSFKSKKSAHILNAERIYKIKNVKPGKELAKKTGCSIGALQKIVKKGQGAYFSSGSRPNQSAHSWGYARLASSITGGKSAAVDFKVLSEGCKKSAKAYKLALKSKKKNGFGTRKVSKI